MTNLAFMANERRHSGHIFLNHCGIQMLIDIASPCDVVQPMHVQPREVLLVLSLVNATCNGQPFPPPCKPDLSSLLGPPLFM